MLMILSQRPLIGQHHPHDMSEDSDLVSTTIVVTNLPSPSTGDVISVAGITLPIQQWPRQSCYQHCLSRSFQEIHTFPPPRPETSSLPFLSSR